MKVALVLVFLIISAPNVFAMTVQDPELVVEEYATGLSLPTSISFIDSDILVLQKNDGKVRLIRDGILQNNTVLDLSVSNNSERGLLGIESVGNNVYLFFTESLIDGGSPLGNRIYKYSWNGTDLINPSLIKDLPVTPGPNHNGGILAKDLDDNIFAIIGDLNRNGVLQNFPSGNPDDTSVILPIDPSGPIHAMGIRNSFGLTIDPVTGNMWDTENGPSTFDEINMISPNFNSGWETIMGPATQQQIDSLPGFESFVYSDPEFSWENTVAPTSILFPDTISFTNYSDSVFVGDCNNGILYKFTLNQSRDSFVFIDPTLTDLVLNMTDNSAEIEFGNGFGCITDIEMGPDNFLYISSLTHGKIYRILPANACIVPNSGDLIITSSCTIYSGIIPRNILVQNNSILTIPSGLTLDVDFSQFNITINFGSGVLIKSGGTIN
ncbi:MAG: PQQ-dependent sugar dehydrogenase [Nitrosopumilus sp.]|nr:PQQ-dependent sugar dehydrogenase [Nitrosopumilus sp.]MDH3385527.1 PQQ-dependent sugar dehydrogenase [Nitrosopumilus sp.]